jgi:hypothetical protein
LMKEDEEEGGGGTEEKGGRGEGIVSWDTWRQNSRGKLIRYNKNSTKREVYSNKCLHKNRKNILDNLTLHWSNYKKNKLCSKLAERRK